MGECRVCCHSKRACYRAYKGNSNHIRIEKPLDVCMGAKEISVSKFLGGTVGIKLEEV